MLLSKLSDPVSGGLDSQHDAPQEQNQPIG
jgi:hypothetical protein